MKKISIIVMAMSIFLVFASCEKQAKSAKMKIVKPEEVVDSVALQLEQELDDSVEVEKSVISIPDFVGIVEAFGSGNVNTASRHLRSIGLKEFKLKKDSVGSTSDRMAWIRGAEFIESASGPLSLRFKWDRMGVEDALALYVDKDKTKSSQIFFTNKLMVPVYVRELQSMGYSLKAEKSNDHIRRYESTDGDEDFVESFTVVISDEGCAVVMQYDMDEDKDN